MIRSFFDQLGREIEFNFPPKRIVSLVPSQTELLADLGLEQELCGITKFCVHPEHIYRSKTRVGGTKTIDFERITQLTPDLIIANKEENQQEQIEQLMKQYPVWISDISDFEQALQMIKLIGEITDRTVEASTLLQDIHLEWKKVEERKQETVLYLIWQNPIMAAGQSTFINAILKRASFLNLLPKGSRYPELTMQEIVSLQPDRLLLSSEPYPFAQKHLDVYQRQLPHSKVQLVDGELFSWYGSRLKCVPSYINTL